MDLCRASHRTDSDNHKPEITVLCSFWKKSDQLFGLIFLCLLFTGCFYEEGPADDNSPGEVVSFSLDIQPIFNNNCTACHPGVVESPDLSEGNSYTSITEGNYIVPNEVDESLLFQRLLGNPSIMPPNGSLPASEINLIRNWIEQGALNN